MATSLARARTAGTFNAHFFLMYIHCASTSLHVSHLHLHNVFCLFDHTLGLFVTATDHVVS